MIFYTSIISLSFLSLKGTSVVHPETQHLIETTIRAPYEIYSEELLKQKHGPPLWFPEPSLDLPRPYRQNGINVGNIGILQIDEPFNFIFLPADDPINFKGIPESFQPLGECDISEVPRDNATCKDVQSEARPYVNLFIANHRTFCHMCLQLNAVPITRGRKDMEILNFCLTELGRQAVIQWRMVVMTEHGLEGVDGMIYHALCLILVEAYLEWYLSSDDIYWMEQALELYAQVL